MVRGILVLSPITYKVNEIFRNNHNINITAQQLDPDAVSVFTFSMLCCAGNMANFGVFLYWKALMHFTATPVPMHNSCDLCDD